MRVRRLMVFVAVFCLLVTAACSGDDDVDAGASDGDADSPSSTSAGDQEGDDTGSDWDDVVAAAQEEGSLVLYAPLDAAVLDRMATAFKDEYGIDIDLSQRAAGAQLIQRFSEEMGSGGSPADVLFLSDLSFYPVAEENGWALALDDEVIPNIADLEPEFAGDIYAEFTLAPLGACYNTDSVEADTITSYDDLLDFDGSIIMPSPAQIAAYQVFWDVVRDSEGLEYLEEFGDKGPTITESIVPSMELLSAGEGDIVFPCFPTFAISAKDRGAPVDYVQTNPTSGYQVGAVINTDADHPNAARVFVNWLLTEEGQQAVNEGAGSSPFGDVPGAVPLPEGYKYVNAATLDTAKANLDENLAALGVS